MRYIQHECEGVMLVCKVIMTRIWNVAEASVLLIMKITWIRIHMETMRWYSRI